MERLRKVDYCLQTETMIKHFSVIDHFRLISEFKNTPQAKIERKIEKLLNVLNLTEVANNQSQNLSLG